MNSKPTKKPVLVFDFDNTLTDGDILDRVIGKFSTTDDWRTWEEEWAQGRLSALDCLTRQVENLRVPREVLFDYLREVKVDPAFSRILSWARDRQVEVLIVSDSFVPLIACMLEHNGIQGVPVFANDLEFSGDRLRPAFPFHDPAHPLSANYKVRHLEPYRDRMIVYAGDGRSDLDPALASDVVFAKDALARELAARSFPFRPFRTLEPVLAFLQALG